MANFGLIWKILGFKVPGMECLPIMSKKDFGMKNSHYFNKNNAKSCKIVTVGPNTWLNHIIFRRLSQIMTFSPLPMGLLEICIEYVTSVCIEYVTSLCNKCYLPHYLYSRRKKMFQSTSFIIFKFIVVYIQN